MPRFAANLTTLFTEVPFLERFARARAAGFDAVEFQFPYLEPAASIAAALRDHGLELALFNLPPGDLEAGECGLAGLAGRELEFAAGMELALDYAADLGCRKLHCMAGRLAEGADHAAAEAVYLANLKWAAARAALDGRWLLIEPISPAGVPGYLLSRFDQAARVIAQIGAANLKLQFDTFHCQQIHGELLKNLADYLPLIGHVQIADVPGRHEPGSGGIDFAVLFEALDRLGYDGWVGCEYWPAGITEAGLGWRRRFG